MKNFNNIVILLIAFLLVGSSIMKRCCLLLLFPVLIFGCQSYSVTLDQNVETIPRELALEYLQGESLRFADFDACIYTNYGITGVPYAELEYVVTPISNIPVIEIWKKGQYTSFTFDADGAFVCRAIMYNIWDDHDYTEAELQEGVNKTVSALESVGVRREETNR